MNALVDAGEAKGEAKGEEKTKNKIAKKMLSQGISPSEIMALTGLSEEELQKLRS